MRLTPPQAPATQMTESLQSVSVPQDVRPWNERTVPIAVRLERYKEHIGEQIQAAIEGTKRVDLEEALLIQDAPETKRLMEIGESLMSMSATEFARKLRYTAEPFLEQGRTELHGGSVCRVLAKGWMILQRGGALQVIREDMRGVWRPEGDLIPLGVDSVRDVQTLVGGGLAVRGWARENGQERLWFCRPRQEGGWETHFRVLGTRSGERSIGKLLVLSSGAVATHENANYLAVFKEKPGGRWHWDSLADGGHIRDFQQLPDGRLVTASTWGRLRIWSHPASGFKMWIQAFRETRAFEELIGHSKSVTCLSVMPDGRVVSGSEDCTLRVWERDSVGEWHGMPLEGHTAGVTSLALMPDGRIVSGSSDGGARVWRQSSGGIWEGADVGKCHGPVRSIEVMSNGMICTVAKGLGIWDESPKGSWEAVGVSVPREEVRSVFSLPNGCLLADETLLVQQGSLEEERI